MCVSKPAGKAQHSSWQEEAEAGVEANADKQRGGAVQAGDPDGPPQLLHTGVVSASVLTHPLVGLASCVTV